MHFLFDVPIWLLASLIIYHLWDRYCRKSRILEFCEYQNGPKALPFIGNFNVLYNKNIFECLSELKKKYSMPYNIWLWNDYYYITDRPHEIKALLCDKTKSFNKAPFYDDLIKVLTGETFIMLPINKYKQWKQERNIFAKVFSPSMWSYYTPGLHEKATKILTELNDIHNFNHLFQIINDMTFEFVMEHIMGIKTNCNGDDGQLLSSLNELLEMLSHRSIVNRVMPRWFWKHFTEEGQKFNYLLKDMQDRLTQLTEHKRRIFLETKEYIQDHNKLNLIELLLLKEDDNSIPSNIYNQIFLLYFTSIETSSLILSYTLVFLGMHPNVQEDVYQEVLNNVGYEAIIPEDLKKLNYLEQTILETIRLLPVVPITGRHITKDINLGDKVLPKGANAAIIPYLVHRNEQYWPNPETFNPDRFSPKNFNNIVVGSYIPFLMGPRDCVGRYFSIAQTKILTANIIRNYKISVDPKVADDLKFKLYIVIKPINDFNVKFDRRKEK